jgi:hypothetical protein
MIVILIFAHSWAPDGRAPPAAIVRLDAFASALQMTNTYYNDLEGNRRAFQPKHVGALIELCRSLAEKPDYRHANWSIFDEYRLLMAFVSGALPAQPVATDDVIRSREEFALGGTTFRPLSSSSSLRVTSGRCFTAPSTIAP